MSLTAAFLPKDPCSRKLGTGALRRVTVEQLRDLGEGELWYARLDRNGQPEIFTLYGADGMPQVMITAAEAVAFNLQLLYIA